MKSSNLKFGDPRYPYMQFYYDTSDNLAELFGPDEKIFPLMVDVDRDDVDSMFYSGNARDQCYDSDDSCSEFPWNRFRRARTHECMWGGQCCNKDFTRARPQKPAPVQRKVPLTPVTKFCAGQDKAPLTSVMVSGQSVKVHNAVRPVGCVRTKAALARTDNSRSLLLKKPVPVPQPQPPSTPQSSRPETPVSLVSDDDLGPIPIDPLNTAGVFRSALDHLTTASTLGSGRSPGDGSFFGDYDRTKQDLKPAIRTQADVLKSSAGTILDHNYGVTSKSVKLPGMGVDTPSDSEEEIDVVSVTSGERSRSGSFTGLPTRPTATDRRQLESLLSASQAVSRKLKRSAPLTCPVTPKRRRGNNDETDDTADSSDDSSDGESDDYDDLEELYDEDFSDGGRSVATYSRPGRPRGSPGRRKKGAHFDEDRRDLHNNMERQRRIDLRRSFEMLRDLVPSVACAERAAKVAILREAAAHCRELNAECRGRSMQVQALKKEQERLRTMVSALRRAAAVCRR